MFRPRHLIWQFVHFHESFNLLLLNIDMEVQLLASSGGRKGWDVLAFKGNRHSHSRDNIHVILSDVTFHPGFNIILNTISTLFLIKEWYPMSLVDKLFLSLFDIRNDKLHKIKDTKPNVRNTVEGATLLQFERTLTREDTLL